MTVREQLFIAHDRIKAGWIKGVYKEKGKYCAVGALDSEHRGECVLLLYEALSPRAKKASSRSEARKRQVIFYYNDAPSRRKRDILNLYQRAIALTPAPEAVVPSHAESSKSRKSTAVMSSPVLSG